MAHATSNVCTRSLPCNHVGLGHVLPVEQNNVAMHYFDDVVVGVVDDDNYYVGIDAMTKKTMAATTTMDLLEMIMMIQAMIDRS